MRDRDEGKGQFWEPLQEIPTKPHVTILKRTSLSSSNQPAPTRFWTFNPRNSSPNGEADDWESSNLLKKPFHLVNKRLTS